MSCVEASLRSANLDSSTCQYDGRRNHHIRQIQEAEEPECEDSCGRVSIEQYLTNESPVRQQRNHAGYRTGGEHGEEKLPGYLESGCAPCWERVGGVRDEVEDASPQPHDETDQCGEKDEGNHHRRMRGLNEHYVSQSPHAPPPNTRHH